MQLEVDRSRFKEVPRFGLFTEEHDALRESIASFVSRELAPHAEEWEETTFPDWVFHRMGELGFLGLDKPEEYGGQGGDYYCSIVLGEEMTGAGSGGLAMGVAVHTDMATPPILAFGTEEQKQRYLVPAIAGQKISCLGITEPDAGSDVAGIKTRAVRGLRCRVARRAHLSDRAGRRRARRERHRLRWRRQDVRRVGDDLLLPG